MYGVFEMGDYVTLKIPKELVDRMDYVISNRIHGYRSRAEIASEGIRIILSGVNNNRGDGVNGSGKIVDSS
jgi:metal-responsive CopG/Arc/MetJ family transcriptional regulator